MNWEPLKKQIRGWLKYHRLQARTFQEYDDMLLIAVPDELAAGWFLESFLEDEYPSLANLINSHGCDHEYVSTCVLCITKKGWQPREGKTIEDEIGLEMPF